MEHGVLALTHYTVHIAVNNIDSLSTQYIVHMEHEEPINYVRNVLKPIIIILFD